NDGLDPRYGPARHPCHGAGQGPEVGRGFGLIDLEGKIVTVSMITRTIRRLQCNALAKVVTTTSPRHFAVVCTCVRGMRGTAPKSVRWVSARRTKHHRPVIQISRACI